jgi:hypothetical protein
MEDDQEYEFMIYHNGVHFTAPVRGKKRFLMERAFLDDLVAPKFGRNKEQPSRSRSDYGVLRPHQ